MRDLSIIIINYNVRFFLELTLRSVYKSIKGINAEVFVVDNHSSDDSVQMVREQFPDVKLIENKDNKGFSKANNQAIAQANGEFILLLNPDTIIAENTLSKCLFFMQSQKDAGALGVKMLGGDGDFLRESKRGLPTPWVAFCKMTGLSSLFPSSPSFGKYHLQYLDKDQIHEVSVLSGAFMLLRKTVLDQSKGLDEDYFMYGEDIDLSYQVIKQGLKNYYFPKTTIIHFKGECTKDSVRSVRDFYIAMNIFARKHFKKSFLKLVFIHLAVYGISAVKLISRLIKKAIEPILHTQKKETDLLVVGNTTSLDIAKRLFSKNGITLNSSSNTTNNSTNQTFDELVYSAMDLNYESIINHISLLDRRIHWKVLSEDGKYIIGKSSKNFTKEIIL